MSRLSTIDRLVRAVPSAHRPIADQNFQVDEKVQAVVVATNASLSTLVPAPPPLNIIIAT